ncbi:MAG: porin [Bacteroidaceae bacterium]
MKSSRILSMALFGLIATPAFSVDETSSETSTTVVQVKQFVSENFSMPTFGGYIVGKYDWNDRRGQSTNGGFDLRYMRFYVDGKCFKDFYYKVQAEMCSAPGVDKGPRILDAFVEWQPSKAFRVKLGQYKRPFSFENPMNPWNVGFGSYSQVITKLAGMSDRVGEHSSGGRDMGLQIQGDLLNIGEDQHSFFHYQVGVFNGQGINHTDKDKFKDLIGGIWFSPLKKLQIGGFGWSGRYTNENYLGNAKTKAQADRNRWGIGVNYESDWTFRAEYIASEGGVVSNSEKQNKADGWYGLVGVPMAKKLKVYGKWDCYRDNKEWNSLKTVWGATANYALCKNLQFQVNYSFTHDRATAIGKNYNTIDLQLYARF